MTRNQVANSAWFAINRPNRRSTGRRYIWTPSGRHWGREKRPCRPASATFREVTLPKVDAVCTRVR